MSRHFLSLRRVHRDGKRYTVRAAEKLMTFLELKRRFGLPQVSLVAKGSERFDSSSAHTTNRFPSPQCASAIQIVRPLESKVET